MQAEGRRKDEWRGSDERGGMMRGEEERRGEDKK